MRIHDPTSSVEQQAEALAASVSDIPFSVIYTSDLKRALSTAKSVHSTSSRSIPLHITSSLREQNFGVAEGTKIVKRQNEMTLSAHYARGLFPILYTRSDKFPEGESLKEAEIRAKAFIEDVLTMWVNKEEDEDTIVGVVSHGIFIGELVAALLRRGDGQMDHKNLRGMKNTAWTQVEVFFEPVLTVWNLHFLFMPDANDH